MGESSMITIVLTCYKQEKFIEETLLSVINQTYENRELLIGDDSPDDNCRNIISKYIKKYPDKIYAWHHSPNKGIVNNMRFLLEQRSRESKYVAFLEGDDCLFPEYLEKKVEIFKAHPSIKLVYNELTTIDENAKIITKGDLKSNNIKFCKKGKINYEKLVNQFYYKSWSSIMVGSDVFDNYELFPKSLGDRTLVSDIYFFNNIAHNEDIYGIEEPLVYYRMHGNSATGDIQGMLFFCLDLIEYIKYLFQQGFIGNGFYKNKICCWYSNIIAIAIKESLKVSSSKTLKLFILGCINCVKWICKECINRIKIRHKKHFN